MNKVCAKHQLKPEMIYHQCIGCELEWLRNRVKELELAEGHRPDRTSPSRINQF